jgi:SAM-dependent methyltransferase
MQLLLGCGHSRKKKLWIGYGNVFDRLRTLDINPACKPDVVHDLCKLPLPFARDSADEIHLYDVLEHTGQQGNWLWFFEQFEEFWRILKPGGHLFGICPVWNGAWAWGDPGHTRVIQPETLTFLSQAVYAAELDGAEPTNRTDYRRIWRGDFDLVWHQDLVPGATWGFALRAIKPARSAG